MDKLEVGDIFYIKVLDETLAYQIDQILTVLPQETDGLSIEPGKDYATLVTCTPFAINTHRLLVRGERIPYEEATKQEPDTNIKPELSFTAKVLIVTIIVIFIGLMIAVIIVYEIEKEEGKVRKKIRSIHIILFVTFFLVGSFIDISTIHAEAGSRTGSIQIIYKGRNSSDKEVTLSGAKFSIFPIQYMKNGELV